MPHVDYYAFTLSPYCYLAGDGLEQLTQRHGASITYKPVNLPQILTRTGGTPLADRHPARLEYRAQDLARRARRLGVPLNVRAAHVPTNPAPSCYAVIAAQKAGGGDVGALLRGLLRAAWAEERDIAEDTVIRACLVEGGFDPALADAGLLTAAETYERNTEEAILAGVFGAPFYVTDDGARFWGQDRLDDLDLHLAGKL